MIFVILGCVADVIPVVSRVGVGVIGFPVLPDHGPLIRGERFEALLLLGSRRDNGFKACGGVKVLRLARTSTTHREGQECESADQPNSGEWVLHVFSFFWVVF